MKKIIACLMACFAVFAFSACSLNKSGTPDSKGKEPLKIICTNFASYDFVRQIVGDKAEVTMLLKPGAEAHSYEPSPKDIQAIGKSTQKCMERQALFFRSHPPHFFHCYRQFLKPLHSSASPGSK